jgi:hypothetical protein
VSIKGYVVRKAYYLQVIRHASLIALCLVLLTGCTSTNSKIPSYDPFDLVVWEKCMDWAIEQKQGALSYNKGDNKYDLQEVIKVCESAEPKPLNP